MNRRNKFISILLVVAFVVTQFTALPWLVSAEESTGTTRIPEEILKQAKENRTPIIWYDFENFELGATSVKDKVSGIVATHGVQRKVDGQPYQKPSPILTTDKYTLNGNAYWPNLQNDLLLPYEPLSQTGDEATIQFWVKMSRVHDFNSLFWAGSVKGNENVQQKNFIGIMPRRGDNASCTYFQQTQNKEGMARVFAQDVRPGRGVWTLLTVTQSGTNAKLYLNDQEVASGEVHFKMSDLLAQVQGSDSTITMDDLKMGIGAFVDGWADDTIYGLIDDFRIYNVALTTDEIKSEFESQKSKIDSLPQVYEVQLTGGPDYPVKPDFTKFAPASRNWNEYSWGYWTSRTGDFYLKTIMKVEKVPGKENSDQPIGRLDRAGGETYDLPAVKEFENGIWRPVVIEVKNAPAGLKEYRFQWRNRNDLYTIHYGPWMVLDTDPTPLELTDDQKAQNEARASGENDLPKYEPASFNSETGFVYKFDGVGHDNFSHNDRSYITVTPNGNYLTSKRDLLNYLTWNGYMDRLGRAKENPLPPGKYDYIFAYKAEGRFYDKDLNEPNQNKENPYLGYFDYRDQGIVIPFGSEEKIDGKWHIEVITVDAKDGIKCDWEFRLRNLFNGGTFTLSVGPIYIIPHQETPAISLDKTNYYSGEDITISFSNLDQKTLFSGKNVSGMKIVKADGSDVEEGVSYWLDFPDEGRNIKDPNGSYTYEFTLDGQGGKFKALKPGQYKMRLQASGQEEIMSVPFTIDAPSISLDKTTYIAGEDIKVTYENIGLTVSGMKIVNKDDSDIEGADYWVDFPDTTRNIETPDGSFVYEFNEDGSNHKFKNLKAGEYKLRLQNKDKSEAMSIEFKVLPKDAPAIALEKTSFKTGEPIKVTYKNIYDIIKGMKIVNKDDSDIEGADYWVDFPDATRNIEIPDGTFTYEFNEDGSDHKFKILPPGEYKLRLQKKDKSEAMSLEFTIEEPLKPSLSLDKTEYEVGESIVVTYKDIDDTVISGMKIVNKDDSDIEGADYWVDFPDATRNIEIPDGTFTYEFNEDGSDHKFKILPPGEYKLRLQRTDKSEEMSIEFIIVEPEKPTPSITLNKTEYEVGESIVVTYKEIDDTISGMKIVNKDNTDIEGASYWIDLPDEGRNVQIPSGTFIYEFNEDGSNHKFKILPAGVYKLRLQNKDKSEAMSVEFTVKEAAVEVDEDVEKVIDLINDLSDEITLDDEDAIVTARKAYDELSDEQKAKIEKSILDKLEAAEKAFEELKVDEKPGEDPKGEDPKGEDPKGKDPSPKTGDIIPSAILTLLTGAASLSLFRKKKDLNK